MLGNCAIIRFLLFRDQMTTPSANASSARGDSKLTPSSLNFPVIGIGASAGGLEALMSFFENAPAHSGMAFVIILHLSPKHESSAAEILQRATAMKVTQVTDPMPVEADHVYVIPPAVDLTMNDGDLRVSRDGRTQGGPHVAIDIFFRTLAEVHRERAVCIVMSGTGSDGAVGLTRVKEMGGITIAQSPDDAQGGRLRHGRGGLFAQHAAARTGRRAIEATGPPDLRHGHR